MHARQKDHPRPSLPSRKRPCVKQTPPPPLPSKVQKGANVHSPRSRTTRWAARWSTPPAPAFSAALSCHTSQSLFPVSSGPGPPRWWWVRIPHSPPRSRLGRTHGCRRWAAGHWSRCWRPTLRDVNWVGLMNERGFFGADSDWVARCPRAGRWWGAF